MRPDGDRPRAAPALLLVAHGTRDPGGIREIERIADSVGETLRGVPVRVAYVDVTGPAVSEALAAITGPVVVVPAFLTAGYHVRHDLPAQLEPTGRGRELVLSAPIGPSGALADAMLCRLAQAGWRRGDRVVLAAAGSSDPAALSDVDSAARLLGARCGTRVAPSYVSGAGPRVAEACAVAAPGRTFVATYLLAPGLFHRRLLDLPVDGVAQPLGVHPRVVDSVVGRYLRARARAARARTALGT